VEDADLRKDAMEALQRLRTQGRGNLVWLVWPDETPSTHASDVEPGLQDWNGPNPGVPYLALDCG
jgi:hypothetical protein